MVFKLKSKRRGDHVHEQVFVGPDVDHLALVGTLVFRIGEWQEFGAALGLGAERMHGMKVVFVGSEAVVGDAKE